MELMRLVFTKRETSEHSLVSIPLSTIDILHMVQNDKVKEEMIDDTYPPVLQSIVYGNEEDRKHRFEGFTIKYYIKHQLTKID